MTVTRRDVRCRCRHRDWQDSKGMEQIVGEFAWFAGLWLRKRHKCMTAVVANDLAKIVHPSCIRVVVRWNLKGNQLDAVRG